MAAQLIPCSRCARHFRRSEPGCPFCGAEQPLATDLAPVVSAPNRRLGRAALFAFGAAAAGAVAVSGCGDDSIASPYGAPPYDSGMEDSALTLDSGSTMDSASDAAPDAATDAATDALTDAAAGDAETAADSTTTDGG